MVITESMLAEIPGRSTWDAVMYGGKICACGHTEVCHWNGENKTGAEAFDQACLMCSGSCRSFRFSGRRTTAQRVMTYTPQVTEVDVDLELELDLEEEDLQVA